jgi:hypothetical protein
MFDSSSGAVTLQDVGPTFPAQNYFYQGHLRCSLDRTGDPNYRAYINTGFTNTGSCATYGKLGYLQGSTTNKCATYPNFQLQANQQNAQLGSRLTVNHVGGFFACGPDEEVRILRALCDINPAHADLRFRSGISRMSRTGQRTACPLICTLFRWFEWNWALLTNFHELGHLRTISCTS